VKIALSGLILAAAAITSAHAGITVTMGSVPARDCFAYAQSGTDLQNGVSICGEALRDDSLSKHDRAGTYVNRGIMLDTQGQTDQAAEDYKAAIALDPALGDSYVNLGALLIKQHRYQEALDQLNKGLELGPSFPHVAYYDRAQTEEQLGHFLAAYYDYKKVLDLEPGYSRATERLKDLHAALPRAQLVLPIT